MSDPLRPGMVVQVRYAKADYAGFERCYGVIERTIARAHDGKLVTVVVKLFNTPVMWSPRHTFYVSQIVRVPPFRLYDRRPGEAL